MKVRTKLAALSALAMIALLAAVPAQAAAPDDDAAADAKKPRSDEDIIVNGTRVIPTGIPDVPGGTSVVDGAELQGARLSNVGDALRLVPGVFAQSIGGGEGTLISVRGSGLTKGGFTYGNGTQLLIDGLPITSLYGTPYESLEPNVVNRVEIFKGANAFEYGATQLGGVINFIQHTGRDADALFARAEVGSYGYQRQQLSSGQTLGDLDYYVSLTHYHTDGYLANSAATSKRAYANAGWQVTPALLTRLYFSYTQMRQENISAQTAAQVFTNPRDSNPFTGTRKNEHSLVFGSRTVLDAGPNSSFELNLGYKSVPLYNGNLPQRTFWDLDDWSASLRFRFDGTIGGHQDKFTAAVLTNFAVPGSGARVFNTVTNATLGRVLYGGHNITLLASNDFAVTPKLWLLAGIAWIDQERHNEILNPVAAGVATTIARSYHNATPRVGLRYDLAPLVSVYANYSKLIETPQAISYTTALNGAYTGFTTAGLRAQKGDSYEAGVRGSLGSRIAWDVAYYNEQLTDELLTVYTVLPNTDPKNPNGVTATTNAAPTVKEGIEASATFVLWREGGSRLSLKSAYTYNNFRFKTRNLALGQGIEPRIPRHFVQADLTFEHASGFYVGGQVETVPSAYPVDYVNRTYAPAYTLWGATLGYAPASAKWRLFVQAQNLGDKKYTSSVSQTFSATAASAIYIPGVGRNITGGVTVGF